MIDPPVPHEPLADVVFQPDTWDRSSDTGPILVAGRCKNCDALAFPVRRFCSTCLVGGPFDRVLLSREGVLYSFSTVRVSVPGFDSPYIVGYVDLPEGLRIFAQLAAAPEELTVSDRMVLVEGPIGHTSGGGRVLGYKFAPSGPALRSP